MSFLEWFDLQGTATPPHLYRVSHSGSRLKWTRNGYNAPTPAEFVPDDDEAFEVTRRHLNWYNTKSDWWISTFSSVELARRWAEILRVKHPNLHCAIERFSTARIEDAIFNAAELIEYFDIPLKASLDITQFKDEYLVANRLPAVARLSSVAFAIVGEEASILPAGIDRRMAARVLPVDLPYLRSFNLLNLPVTLYRVLYPKGHASCRPDEELISRNYLAPSMMNDVDFKKAVHFQVTGNTRTRNRGHFNMFGVFSNKQSAIKHAKDRQKSYPDHPMALVHIDSRKLGDIESRYVYHSAYVINELRIPLNQGVQLSRFFHEYLIMNGVPSDAISKIENLEPHIPSDIDLNRSELGARQYMEAYSGSVTISP